MSYTCMVLSNAPAVLRGGLIAQAKLHDFVHSQRVLGLGAARLLCSTLLAHVGKRWLTVRGERPGLVIGCI